jgi:hypothetical protein
VVELLAPVRAHAHLFGGSHAQRDVLSLTLLEAALRGRLGDVASAVIDERLALKAASPFNWAQAARVREQIGDLDGAGSAAIQAASLQRRSAQVRTTADGARRRSDRVSVH